MFKRLHCCIVALLISTCAIADQKPEAVEKNLAQFFTNYCEDVVVIYEIKKYINLDRSFFYEHSTIVRCNDKRAVKVSQKYELTNNKSNVNIHSKILGISKEDLKVLRPDQFFHQAYDTLTKNSYEVVDTHVSKIRPNDRELSIKIHYQRNQF